MLSTGSIALPLSLISSPILRVSLCGFSGGRRSGCTSTAVFEIDVYLMKSTIGISPSNLSARISPVNVSEEKILGASSSLFLSGEE